MKTQIQSISGLLLVALLACPSTASAGVVLNYLGQYAGSSTTVHLGSATFNTTQGGPFEWQVASSTEVLPVLVDHFPPVAVNKFTTFCIEATEYLSGGYEYNVFQDALIATTPKANPGYGAMGSTAADLMRILWARNAGTVFDGVGPTTDERSAFQLALWELVYDNGVVNLTSGDLWADNSASNTVFELATSWLQDASNHQEASQPRASLIVFSNERNSKQDQVGEYVPPPHQNEPLPEPATAVIWSLILGVAGVVHGRRRCCGR